MTVNRPSTASARSARQAHEPGVLLDGDHPSPFLKKGPGQAARPWADLKNGFARFKLGQAGDLAADIEV